MRAYEFIVEKSQWERNIEVQKDQIFTRPEVAKQFGDWVKARTKDATTVIEPSAGDGQILMQFPGAIGYDIEPRGSGIQQADWLKTQHQKGEGKILVVGNPPFGKAGNLAVKFINHAAKFADYIAFILPRSFKKESIQNRISLDFTLADEYLLPKNSFYLPHEGTNQPYDVPCVAQLWVKKRREIKALPTSQYIQFVSPEQADIAVLRIGRRAGDVKTIEDALPRAGVFHFIKILQDKDRVISALKNADWSDVKANVAGAYSISRSEILNKVNDLLS